MLMLAPESGFCLPSVNLPEIFTWDETGKVQNVANQIMIILIFIK
jgi:hypothetical protein